MFHNRNQAPSGSIETRTRHHQPLPPRRVPDTKSVGQEAMLRMTAIERASQQRLRAGPSTATQPTAATAAPPGQDPAHKPGPVPVDQHNGVNKSRQRPLSFAASRSTTMPNLSLHSIKAPPPPPNPLGSHPMEPAADDQLDDPSSPSICHSPTWSLSANEKSRKEEKRIAKERKKQEERARKEEQKRLSMVNKAGKRLSKKPPPAMETQRMSMNLARPTESIMSTSQGNTSQSESRPSSREDKSSPATSVTGNRLSEASGRSSNSQPASPSEVPRAFALKPEPKPRPTSRPGSSHRAQQASKSSDDESAYLNDLTDFAFQINYSAQMALSNQTTPRGSPREGSFPQAERRPSATLPSTQNGGLPGAGSSAKLAERASIQTVTPPVVSPEPPVEPKDTRPLAHSYASFSQPYAPGSYRSRTFDSAQRPPQPGSQLQPTRPAAAEALSQHPAARRLTYVQQVRMGREKRSMDGYQDEIAVAKANEMLLMEASRMPPTPDDSTESLQEGSEPQGLTPTSLTPEAAGPPPRSTSPRPISKYNPYLRPADIVQQQQRSRSSDIPRAAEPEKPALQRPQDLMRATTDPETRTLPAQAVPASAAPSQPHIATAKGSPLRPEPLRPNRQSRQAPSPSTQPSRSSARSSQQSTPTQSPPAVPAKPPPPARPASPASPTKATSPTKAAPLRAPPVPEVVVEGVDGDGLVRKTSIKRPRSDPELQAVAATAAADPAPALPPLDFLPQLKHQPLTKPKRASLNPGGPPRVSFALAPEPDAPTPPAASAAAGARSSPPPARPASFAPPPSGPALRPSLAPGPHRASFGPGTAPAPSTVPTTTQSPTATPTSGGAATFPASVADQRVVTAGDALRTKPVAKMFVICCACKFWHDLPSRLYEAMALPRPIQRVDELLGSGLRGDDGSGPGDAGKAKGVGGRFGKGKSKDKERERRASQGAVADGGGALTGPAGLAGRVEGKVYTTVRCPWCEHPMSTGCCAGWTTIVYLHERHH